MPNPSNAHYALVSSPSGVLSNDCTVTLHETEESAMQAMRERLERVERAYNYDQFHEPGFVDEVSRHGHCPTTGTEWQIVKL